MPAFVTLTKRVKSTVMLGWLQEARELWRLKKVDAATERALRVYRAEGRQVFAPSDAALLEATLARVKKPRSK